MEKIDKLRSQLIDWNNSFPLDRIYRQKHNILFNSDDHRRLCQVDIYLDWLESELFKEYEADFIQGEKRAELYKKGIWLREPEEQEMTDEDFDKIVI